MPEMFASKKLRRVRHNPWLIALSALPALAAIALVAMAPARDKPIGLLGLALLVPFLVLQARPAPRITPVQVKASREGLQLGGRMVPRAQIREAVVLPKAGRLPARVRVVRRGVLRPAIELVVRDVAKGRELLRALGFDASQAVASASTMSRAVASLGAFMGIGFGVVGSLIAVAVVLMHQSSAAAIFPLLGALATALGMGVLGVIQTRLDIGADGISARWLWWRRFLRWTDVASFSRYEVPGLGFGHGSRTTGIALELRSGEVVRFPIGTAWDADHLAMIEERMREALDTHARGGVEPGAALLARGARSMGEWISHLRSIGAGANAGLRTAPVDRDRLWRVVEDPQAGATARAAAAVALGAEIDELGRGRLAAAAEATVAPKLRIAIEAAAGADADAASSALAELEAADGVDEALVGS